MTQDLQKILNSLETLYKELSPKKMKFVTKYLETGNCAEASRFAGYKPQNGHRLMINDDKIKKILNLERLQMLQASYERRFEITLSLRKIADQCQQSEKYKDAVKCFELESKLLGLFDIDRQEVSQALTQSTTEDGTFSGPYDFNNMSIEELDEYESIINILENFDKKYHSRRKDSA